jgi:hypothetical protein
MGTSFNAHAFHHVSFFSAIVRGIGFEHILGSLHERRLDDGLEVLPLGQLEFNLLKFGRAESLFRRALLDNQGCRRNLLCAGLRRLFPR